MKIRSTVFWPERDVKADEVIDLPEDVAKARIKEGFAVEHVEPEPPAEPAAEPQA
jgi:hypothetical protein